ncbi:MAG: glycosyltransferase family 39 protein, partial [bacterium]
MNPVSRKSHSSWQIVAVLLALMVFLAWLQFIQWPMPVTGGIDHRDSGVFAYGGWVIASGGVPYLDFWDQKPPLVFLLNALAIRMSGMELTGAWWLSLLVLLVTVPLAWWVLRRWTGTRPALIAMGLYAVSFTGVLQAGNSIELYTLPCRWLLWALALLWIGTAGEGSARRKGLLALFAGVLAGMLFSLRQNEMATAVALGAVLTWQIVREKKYSDLFRLYGGALLGFLLVWIPILIYLGQHHALSQFWDQVFRYNFQHKIINTPLHRLVAFGAIFDHLPLYGAALLGWLLILTGKTGRRKDWGFRERLLIGVLPLETIMVLVSGQRFPHYYISLLPLCALAVAWLIERAERGWERYPVLTRRIVLELAVVVAVVTLIKTPHNLIRPVYSIRGRIEHEAADRLRQMASPDDTLLVWGMAP